MRNRDPAHGVSACHERSVHQEVDRIRITDRVVGVRESLVWRFVMHPSASMEVMDSGFSIRIETGIQIQLTCNEHLNFSVGRGCYSNFYGSTTGTCILLASAPGEAKCALPSEFEWEIRILSIDPVR